MLPVLQYEWGRRNILSVGLQYRSTWFVLWVILIVSPGWIFFVRIYEERELQIRFGPPM
jgi:hypothetical protein